ncbi:hypothetical protein ZWY2020_042832 [Hordeum vulgare]|nr:hypothetical protein ZWY2020_042832 [Hordeum vulgare]
MVAYSPFAAPEDPSPPSPARRTRGGPCRTPGATSLASIAWCCLACSPSTAPEEPSPPSPGRLVAAPYEDLAALVLPSSSPSSAVPAPSSSNCAWRRAPCRAWCCLPRHQPAPEDPATISSCVPLPGTPQNQKELSLEQVHLKTN